MLQKPWLLLTHRGLRNINISQQRGNLCRSMAAESEEKYTFFWKIESPFSQFHPSVFTVDDIRYSCAEQFMMHQKAKVFGDDEIGDEITREDQPIKIKALGRQVRNFDELTWKQQCREIVKRGNLAKFTQNEDLKQKLLETQGTVLVEASPHDRIWGIGLAAENPAAMRKRTWRGSNWLGYALTDVRQHILEQENHSSKSTTVETKVNTTMTPENEEQYTFFWKKELPFSQFYPSEFTVDGTTYKCAQQYMVHQKAKLFGDNKIADKIMQENNPGKIKALGRKVRNFDERTWNQHCREIVKRGNFAKFTQNEDLKEQLLETQGTVLVEATPHDCFWGIGLAADNPAAMCKRNWRGSNWLGYALTDVRQQILEQENNNLNSAGDEAQANNAYMRK